jgi:hypothetical protein
MVGSKAGLRRNKFLTLQVLGSTSAIGLGRSRRGGGCFDEQANEQGPMP